MMSNHTVQILILNLHNFFKKMNNTTTIFADFCAEGWWMSYQCMFLVPMRRVECCAGLWWGISTSHSYWCYGLSAKLLKDVFPLKNISSRLVRFLKAPNIIFFYRINNERLKMKLRKQNWFLSFDFCQRYMKDITLLQSEVKQFLNIRRRTRTSKVDRASIGKVK